jgi:hypothetical protein
MVSINERLRKIRQVLDDISLAFALCLKWLEDDLEANTADHYAGFENKAHKIDGTLQYEAYLLSSLAQYLEGRGIDDSGMVRGAIEETEDLRKRFWNLRLDAYSRAREIDGVDPSPPTEAEVEQDNRERELAYATGGANLVWEYSPDAA